MPRASHSPGMWLYHDNQTPLRHLIAIMTFLSGLCMNTLFKEITLITRNFHLVFKYLNWMVYQDEVPSLQCLTGIETGLLIWAEQHQGLITDMQMHSLLFRMAVFQISQQIQIFHPYFGNSNPWRTHPTKKKISKEMFKIKRIEDGAFALSTQTCWFKHQKEVAAPLTDFINLAGPLNWSSLTYVRHSASHQGFPMTSSDSLQWLAQMLQQNSLV